MPGGVRTIAVKFAGDATGLNKAADQGAAATKGFSDKTKKFAKAAMVGVAGIAAGIGAGLKAGVAGIKEGEEAEARLADAMSRSTPKIQGATDAIKKNAEAIQAKTKFSYEDALGVGAMLAAQDGMQKAVANGTTTIEEATNVSLDMATAMGVDAPAAAKQMAKMMAAPEKATAALRKAGVSLTAAEQDKIKEWVKGGDTAKAQGLIMDKLKEKSEGAAKAAGETTEGQMTRAKAAFGEVQESLATQLMPALTTLMEWFGKVTTWMTENESKVKIIVLVVGGLALAVGAVSAAISIWASVTKAYTAVQAAFNAVMALNPVVLITLAIIALIAIIVVIATKTTWFQDLWSAVWGKIKGAVSAVFGWIKSNWPLILAIITGPIGLAVLAIVKNWDKIKDGVRKVKDFIVEKFNAVVDFLKGLPGKIGGAVSGAFNGVKDAARAAFDWVKDKVTGAIDFYRSLPGKLGNAFAGMFDGIKDAFKSALNWLIGKWNGLEFKIPSIGIGPFKTPGGTVGVPDIPYMATGGTLTRGGSVMVGERGPELLSLPRGAQVTPLGGGGGMTVEIHATGPTLADIVRVELREANRRTKAAVQRGAIRVA